MLANLFLHYVFDVWMKRNHPQNLFARYADDIVIHCRTQEEAEELLEKITKRLSECKLSAHPLKTKIVYCKDRKRRENYKLTAFNFLGYTFKPRIVRNKMGEFSLGFTPAISKEAEKSIKETIRSWKIYRQTDKDMESLSRIFNPKLRGWMAYYGKFRPSELLGLFTMFQRILVKWAKRKYKRLRGSYIRAMNFIRKISQTKTALFAHWERGWCLY